MSNLLKDRYPELLKEWDYEKNNIDLERLTYGSNKKVWWICKIGHSYNTIISSRTLLSTGCPFCSGNKAGYENSLLKTHSEISKQWDYKKNELRPEDVTFGSEKKVWWVCSKKHSFYQRINKRTRRSFSCPYCSGQKVGYGNDLKSRHPKIAKEWDYKKNELRPEDVTPFSTQYVWWICSKKHSYQSKIANRSSLKTGCPYCSGQKVGYGNDLKSRHPKIAKEWDYKKNELRPKDVTSGSEKKVWWICKIGHSYYSGIQPRTNLNAGCPLCVLTPRSREEVYLLFELKQFFNIDENNHKIKLKRVEDVDIKLAIEKVVIEYDGSYWHKDKAERDKTKTKALEKAGWTVIRVREKPLKVLSRTYNVSSKTGEYKETANKVLKKLNQLGYEVKSLDKYLERKTLINKKEAEKYIDKLLKEKNKK